MIISLMRKKWFRASNACICLLYTSPTWGVPVEEIQLGIKNGVRKINVDTDSRLAITGAIRKVFFEKPEEFDPRSYLCLLYTSRCV